MSKQTITTNQKTALDEYAVTLRNLRNALSEAARALRECRSEDVDFDDRLDVRSIEEMVADAEREVDSLADLDVEDEADEDGTFTCDECGEEFDVDNCVDLANGGKNCQDCYNTDNSDKGYVFHLDI
jgi:formylmethanofuran dehydrogenase subunit E